jgi:hypothetical protein
MIDQQEISAKTVEEIHSITEDLVKSISAQES